MNSPYTQSLLLYAYQASAAALVKVLGEKGHTQIRPKHGAVFANIDAKGTRASVLAMRAGIGRPAMGELVDELAGLGYVERMQDPVDRRAKLVVPTERALGVTQAVHEFNMALEADYRASLGEEAYRSLRASLTALCSRNDVQPRIPPDRRQP
ncbi:MarR family winged helix-turn-helix transcriptional regulator [Mesorhizobium sp. CC13]|uniref:MarR family winged helix-turn-helix transcriptional regulator n=1 Tax=Mesorhizobium sp. CC13 TaxID=3029194 RepID=UPI00326400C9